MEQHCVFTTPTVFLQLNSLKRTQYMIVSTVSHCIAIYCIVAPCIMIRIISHDCTPNTHP